MSRLEPHAEFRGGVAAGIRTFFITDIRGYTRFSQARGDEAAARLAEAFAQLVGEAVVGHGGEVVEVRGDEVLAVFASPRRAIRAAVELQSALGDEIAADPSVPLLAGVGLDAGEAVPVGEGGFRGRALNLAARLCALAAAGEVLASAEVVHLAGMVDGVEYRGMAAVEVKGIAHPVEVIAVVGHARERPVAMFKPLAVTTRPEVAPELDPLTPLFGRDRELGVLRWWWRRARHGHGLSGFIVGDSGMGKTRLVAELARHVHADGWTVLYVRGAAPATDSLEVLRRAGAAQEATLVIVDDLDMCGGTVLDTVGTVLAEAAARPVLVAGAYRESSPLVDRLVERGDPAGLHRLSLGPLDPAATEQIAASYLHGTRMHAPGPQVLTHANGVPGLVHRVVGEWVTEQAARRVNSAVSAAAADRPRSRATTAQLATNVVDLGSARERVRLYTTEVSDAPAVCPFKGLASFERSDADYFFGRERLIAELTASVVGAGLLGVVGPSGSGKSSAVKAGLMPALAAGTLPGSDDWQQILLRPGPHPMAELLVHREVLDATDGRQVVLVADQFEEVFTACSDEAERAAFVARLTSFAERDDRLVVVAMRADFYGRCAAYPVLAGMFADNHVLVGPMDAQELQRAILLPARRAGLTVEEGLADALVADVAGEPGGLPLLSTTLLELWRRRSGRTLTVSSYHATSGVHGAVARLAEDAYARLSASQQTLTRSLFLRLAVVGEGGVLLRRRAPVREFDTAQNQDTAQVLGVLTDARLLTRSDEHIEVAHEALLREWPRLRDWLEEDAYGRDLHLHLIHTAGEWDQHGRDRGELYRGARLSSALDWATQHDADLNQMERDFLTASRAVHRHELQRLRLLLAGALVFLVVAAVAGVSAFVQRNSADRAATVADAQRLGAQALVEPHLDRSLLLAREAVNLAETRSTSGNLFAALLRSPAALRVLHVSGGFGGEPLALNPDASTLVVASGDGLAFYDTRTWRRVASMTPPGFGNGGGAGALAYTHDGSLLAVGGGGATIDLLDARTHRAVRGPMHVPNAEWIAQLAFSPNGHTLAVGYAHPDARTSCDGAYWVTRFDVLTGRRLRPAVDISGSHPCVDPIDKLIYSPSGDRLIAADWSGGQYGKIVVLAPRDLSVLRTYRVPGVTAVAPSPDGRTLAVGRDDGSVAFMNMSSGNLRFTHNRHAYAQGVWSIAFTPDGRTAVSTSADHTAIVWDVRSGNEREVLTGHTDAVKSEAISKDGQTLYTGSADGTVIAWDLGGRRGLGRVCPSFCVRYG